MKRGILFALLTLSGCSSDMKNQGRTVERKSETVVEFDELTAKPPSAWVQETPSSSMGPQFAPLYQFRLPRVDGDATDAEVRISRGIGGGVEGNISRWKGQFDPPEGKASEIKIAGRPATVIDLNGTFLGAPGQKGRFPNYRMIGIHFDAPQRVYHVILRGPAATVTHYKKGFDEWLKEFK